MTNAQAGSKISQKLDNMQKASVFEKGRNSSKFEQFYLQNKLPCQINHGSIKNELIWTNGNKPHEIDVCIYLPLFFEGLKENKYPYDFISKEAIKAICAQDNIRVKSEPVFSQLVTALRECLCSSDDRVFSNGLLGLKCLSRATREDLNSQLRFLMSSLNKGLSKKPLKNDTIETL